jgi:diguanylate cyclase (GGDEF)-like protein/PAS domain S-box-containing protein
MSVRDPCDPGATPRAAPSPGIQFESRLGVARAFPDGALWDVDDVAAAALGARAGAGLFDALDALEPGLRALAKAMAPGQRLDRRAQTPGGAHVSLALLRDGGGFHAIVVDETRLSAAETEARRQRARFEALSDAALRAGVYTLDAAGRVSAWSRSAERFEGLSASEALGLRLPELLRRGRFSVDGERLLREAAQAGESAFCGRRADRDGPSGPMTVSLRALRTPEGALDGYVVVVRDAGAVTAREAELRRLAETDPLTGVLNRRAFFQNAEAAIARARARGEPMALIAFDLDDFKSLNDRFGHAAGDAALRAMTETARCDVRDGDVIGRLGGDEFAIALPRADLDRAARIAERLRGAVARVRAVAAGGHAAVITASFGVAAAEAAKAGVADLLAAADAALYRAKAEGKNRIACA